MKIFSDIYEKKVDVVQRKKQARRMEFSFNNFTAVKNWMN